MTIKLTDYFAYSEEYLLELAKEVTDPRLVAAVSKMIANNCGENVDLVRGMAYAFHMQALVIKYLDERNCDADKILSMIMEAQTAAMLSPQFLAVAKAELLQMEDAQ